MSLHSVCVYCGSSNQVDEKYKQLACQVGKALAARGYRVVYGGGHVGLMGVLADAALGIGGEVVGIIPEHIRSHEVQHKGLTELFVVDSMHERKSLMAEKADAFIVLPGGFGTLDEAFEILTWKQLSLHNKPVVIFNLDGFWDPMLRLVENLIDKRFAPKDNLNLYREVNTIDGLLAALLEPASKTGDLEEKWK